MLAFLLISQGFVFSSGSVALAQKRSLPVAGAQQRPTKRTLTAETPQISSGALMDQEIQRNPDLYKDTGQSASPTSKGRTPTITGEEPNPLAPLLGTTFDAINFNEDASLNGFFHIPPDPAGAVGPTHVVNVVNTSIQWFTKAGVRQNHQALSAFFASQAPLTNTFDPKVIYDQYAGRFVVVTMERVDGAPNQSRVFLAVSDNSDPNGVWFFQTLITEEIIDPDGPGPIGLTQSWADFPGFAVDSEAVYFTTNMFGHPGQPTTGFTGQRLWIMAKAPWYTGGIPVATRFDPSALAGGDGAVATTMQPTQMYGDTPGGVGTYLLTYSGLNLAGNLFVQIVQVDNPLTAPTFTGHFSLWGTVAADDNIAMALPSAPQLGSARTIATNDRRISQNGVHRGNFIYCAAPTRRPVAPDANQVTAHWWKIDSTTLNPPAVDTPPVDQGNIGGEDIAVGTYTFFPSVAVDSAGNMAVGFAASGPNIFPGAFYTGRLAGALAGTTQPAGVLRAGHDFYIRDFTASMVVASRWGDYSGLWLDPADETTFWVFNEYALPRGTILGCCPEEDGRWGNAWGSFSLATPAGATPLGAVLISEFRATGFAVGSQLDEFVEIYNNTNATITVSDVNPPAIGPSGWAIVSAENTAVAKAIIPSGTTIPARGHYLVATSAYTLGEYPSGNNGLVATNATPDLTYAGDIPLNRGIALFRTANPASFTLAADRLDAVGPASETLPAAAPYREGTGLPDIGLIASDYSWARRLPGGCTGTQPGFINHNCTSDALIATTPAPASGNVQDTGDNVTDFIFVDVNGNFTPANNGRLGAPGPENLTSPIVRAAPSGSGTINPSLVFPCLGSGTPPNRVRDPTPGPPLTSNLGTIDIRRRFTNNTGQSLTRLRFRIMDITTFPALNGGPGNIAADLRAVTSMQVIVPNPCPSGTTTLEGTTLEVDAVGNPGQPNGGGFNSSFSAGTVTLGAPLASGATIDLRFVFGVQQSGKFRVFVTVEALP